GNHHHCSDLANAIGRTYFGAPIVDLIANHVANFADLFELLHSRTFDSRWVGKAPVQSLGRSGKDGTLLCTRFIANGDDIGEELAGFENVEDRLRFFVRDIDAGFIHDIDNDGIECAGLESGAMRFKRVAAKMIEPRFSHLAAGAVVHADEEHFRFHKMRVKNAEAFGQSSAPLRLCDNVAAAGHLILRANFGGKSQTSFPSNPARSTSTNATPAFDNFNCAFVRPRITFVKSGS